MVGIIETLHERRVRGHVDLADGADQSVFLENRIDLLGYQFHADASELSRHTRDLLAVPLLAKRFEGPMDDRMLDVPSCRGRTVSSVSALECQSAHGRCRGALNHCAAGDG